MLDRLPADADILSKLVSLTDDRYQELLDDGTIHPSMGRNDMAVHAAPDSPQRDLASGGTRGGEPPAGDRPWPTPARRLCDPKRDSVGQLRSAGHAACVSPGFKMKNLTGKSLAHSIWFSFGADQFSWILSQTRFSAFPSLRHPS